MRCSSKACGLISLHRLLKFGLHECVFRLSSTKGCTNTLNTTPHTSGGRKTKNSNAFLLRIHSSRSPSITRANTNTQKHKHALPKATLTRQEKFCLLLSFFFSFCFCCALEEYKGGLKKRETQCPSKITTGKRPKKTSSR